MSDKKQRIIKDIFTFTGARYFSQGIGFFTAIAMRKFLGPFYMGVWSLLKVGLGYVTYLFMGVDQGVSNRIPFFAGEVDKTDEEEFKNTAFTYILIVSILTSIGVLVAAVLLRHLYPKEVVVGLYVVSVYLVLSNFNMFYQILLRAKHNFSVLSKTIVLEAVINLILVVLLVSNFKLYGLYIVLLLVTTCNIIYMHFLARYKFNIGFSWVRLKELIRVGFPIMIVGLCQWVLASIDRIMIGKMIGVIFVGYYSIPLMAKSYVGQLSSFGTVLYPRLMEDYGKRKSMDDIRKYVTVPAMVVAHVLPVILGFVFFIVPLLVEKILPKFIPGIPAMQILLLEMFFAACLAQAFYFLVAMNKQARVIPIVIGAIILNVIGNYTLIKMGYGISGVAWATSGVTFLYFIAVQGYAMKHFANAKDIVVFIVKIVIPLLYTVILVMLINKFVTLGNMYVELIVRSVLLVFFSIPLFVHINRKTGLIRTAAVTVWNRIKGDK